MEATYRAYLRTWLLVTCAIVLAVALFNLVVDPYGVYRIAEFDGFNRVKARAGQRGSLFKVHALERIRPTSVILGNSRAEVGFDPAHPAFARTGGPAVNLALPGKGLEVSVQFLRHAISLKPPKIAIVGLDFVDARTSGNPQRALHDYQQLSKQMSAPLRDWQRGIADHVDTLASLDALYDAISTIRANRRPNPPELTELGFNPMREYVEIARAEGYYALFLQRDLENAKSYLQGPKDVFVQGSRTSSYFEALRELIASCREAGIELHLVIYPYHAHILELFHLTGLWTPFEDWKRRLVQILQEEAALRAAAVSYSLWDFSGYNEFTTERIPERDDRRSQTKWYWEAGHFKKDLGDRILDRILGDPSPRQSPGENLGVNLVSSNIEQHLSQVRTGRLLYHRDYPGDTAQLRDLVESLAKSRRQ